MLLYKYRKGYESQEVVQMKKEFLFTVKLIDVYDNVSYEKMQDTLERVMLSVGYYNNINDLEVLIRDYDGNLVARNIYGNGWQIKSAGNG